MATAFVMHYSVKDRVCPIAWGVSQLVLVRKNQTTILIDKTGALRCFSWLAGWARGTLRPLMVRKFGTLALDAVVQMRPTYARLRAAAIVAQQLGARKIMVPEDLFQELDRQALKKLAREFPEITIEAQSQEALSSFIS